MNHHVPLARGRAWRIERPQVVAILNATPDSFSDGGGLGSPEALERRIQQGLDEGADAFDVGGESTRPGFTPVSMEEELQRVLPVIRSIRHLAPHAIVSIDTSKASVAQAALAAGADFINDVSALGDLRMASVAAEAGCAVVLMRHESLGGPPLAACAEQLEEIVSRARLAGLDRPQIVLDPGLGFGERPGPSVDDNLALLRGIDEYAAGHPVMIGHSRKRFVRALHPRLDVDEATARLSLQAANAGAAMLRVHNVAATVRALAQ